MKTEYRTYTIETDQRNPYAQKGEVEFMYYPTAEGVQHDADQDGEDLVYCGNCKWVDSLEEAQGAIDDLIIEQQGNRIEVLKDALRSVVRHGLIEQDGYETVLKEVHTALND